MAISTANTTLMYKTTDVGTYAKLVDIINYPDMGSAPSKLDTTTLTETKLKTNILGLQEAPELTFEANYTKEDYDAIEALESSTIYLQLQFGAAGVDGMFSWQGKVRVYANGAAVDEVRKMTIVCSAETAIVQS